MRTAAVNLANNITIKGRSWPAGVGDSICESSADTLDLTPNDAPKGMGKTDRVRVKSDREAKPAEIGVLIYPGVQVSAVGGLTDLFATANRLSMERCAAGSRTLRITPLRARCVES
jgi:hypothetical protein